MLRCRLNDDDPAPSLELPDWMFDRATCGRMKLTTAPFVSAEHLLAVRTLLRAQGLATSRQDRVQERHRPTPSPGDADATPPPSEAQPARPVHPAAGATDLGDAVAGDPSQGLGTHGTVAPGGTRPASRRRKRQGGGS